MTNFPSGHPNGTSAFEAESSGGMPPNGNNHGGALTTVSNGGNQLPITFPGAAMAPAKDVIRGGMDGSSLFHSFRRRWLLALGMGLVAATVGGVLMYMLFPESAKASKQFRVASSEATVLEGNLGQTTQFDIFKKTQIVLIKGPFVLNAALGDPSMSNLAFFDGVKEEEKMTYLRDELQVNFPQDAEVLQIELSGSVEEEELETIVKAVSKAYEDEVVFSQNADRLKPRDILRNSYRKLTEEVRRKQEAIKNLMEDLGRGSLANGGFDAETKILLTEIGELSKQIANQKQQLVQLGMGFQMNKSYLEDERMIEKQIEAAVAQDPMIMNLENQVMNYEMYLMTQQSSGGRRPSSGLKSMQKTLDSLQQQLAERRQAMITQYKIQQQTEPNDQLRMLMQEWRMQQAVMSNQIKQAEDRMTEIQELLKEKNEVDVELAMRMSEVTGLEEVQQSIAMRIEQWDVESGAPNRISAYPGIEVTPGINRFQRAALTGLGSLASFGLTCFGIAYLEFRNRRLNGPDQVDEGLGIRVIGTLPSLSGRKALNPNHPVVAQLTESIDSVRTALMHESTTNKRQIVMVTSAAAMEGRTTVASQLAASLARAGRRTLLIDGDLRRPSLHGLFDVPLEDGLCEVLRAETDAADVIRPTHAEGLWLLTAGYCDADAVHALATDQVQPIFDKLRADYDFIIIDASPVLGLSDSLLFGQHCDGAILSVLRDHTNVPKIHQASELLKSVGIRLMGSVVNGVPTKADRRVTYLQAVTPKKNQKQLEEIEA